MARWKIIEDKFISMSRGISFSEAVTLLGHYGYRQDNKGKTSGSRYDLFAMDIVIFYYINHIHKKN